MLGPQAFTDGVKSTDKDIKDNIDISRPRSSQLMSMVFYMSCAVIKRIAKNCSELKGVHLTNQDALQYLIRWYLRFLSLFCY